MLKSQKLGLNLSYNKGNCNLKVTTHIYILNYTDKYNKNHRVRGGEISSHDLLYSNGTNNTNTFNNRRSGRTKTNTKKRKRLCNIILGNTYSHLFICSCCICKRRCFWMKKKITKIGNSYVLSFTKQEREIYNLQEGTLVDLSDMSIISKKLLSRGLYTELEASDK